MSEQDHKNMPEGIKQLTGLLQNEDGSPANLKSWEKQAVMLHLEGWPASQIAAALQKHPGTVRKVLKKDATQKLIDDYDNFVNREYESLYSMAVQAIRDGLDPQQAPLAIRVRTAEAFIKGKQEKNKGNDEAQSAETIVQQVINVYNQNNQKSVEDSSPQEINIPTPPKEDE